METASIPDGKPTELQLRLLAERCDRARERLKAGPAEVALPLFIEFAGSPKSGKSTIIGIVAHFFKRRKFDVIQPAEGASLRTPPGLREDLVAFNAWSGCYALQHILIDSSDDPPPDIVFLDRGLFDVSAWMELLCSELRRISVEDRDLITSFFLLEVWRRRENAVFLFTADHATSLERETQDKLTYEQGLVMNADMLDQLKACYDAVAQRQNGRIRKIYSIDTSFVNGKSPSFQQVAYVVAEKIVQLIEELSTQVLLVTVPVAFHGFQTDPAVILSTAAQILNSGNPMFRDRSEAELTLEVQQVVPYSIIQNKDGLYFCARRRADSPHKALQGKYTLLVGGHAELRDWNPSHPEGIFEGCLRRELEEELIGIQILNIQRLGFINDTRNKMGSHHLAFIHRAEIGGKASIRRQTIDKEFGRESVGWKSESEIKAIIGELDPWSQLVAAKMFDIHLPASESDPTLFARSDP